MAERTSDLTSAAVPLQVDFTIGIAALVTIAMTVFALVLLYLAFGPHNRQLEAAVTSNGSSQVDRDETELEHAESRSDDVELETGSDDGVGLESDASTSPGDGDSKSLEER
ncbi:hypothetical protein [Natrarchaeobaculum sulfurireducens]|uniref:Uncharacterized protein n=1 Tax=Natrarchaeobaculum sulfurireducens TaxID=2044521 RepID=A0A346PTC7_9EURY|nr:hypothetical protein [Natrarchaeobaculum sulfurireducens]AXR77266.1 hypothetical protein AArc1_0925 [Natrarchaeobaculum sulfurireducens]AXR82772.1 hypothetical protein AArcMg_2782 [Natrarchaeobaculum sulfurireducens]